MIQTIDAAAQEDRYVLRKVVIEGMACQLPSIETFLNMYKVHTYKEPSDENCSKTEPNDAPVHKCT